MTMRALTEAASHVSTWLFLTQKSVLGLAKRLTDHTEYSLSLNVFP